MTTRTTRPRIGLFEAAHHGHHPYFLRLLLEEVGRTDYGVELCLVVSPRFVAAHPDVIALCRALPSDRGRLRVYGEADEAAIDAAPASRGVSAHAVFTGAFDPTERSSVTWALACRESRALDAAHLVLMFLDACYYPLASHARAPCRVSGIFFRPSFHYGRFSGEATERRVEMARLQERLTIARLLGHPDAGTIFTLDPFFRDAVGPEHRDRVLLLEDPVPLPPDDGADVGRLRRGFGVEEGRRVLLFFGQPQARKGILQLLDALASMPPLSQRRLCLLMAGPESGIDPMLLNARLQPLTAQGLVQVVRRAEHVPQAEVGDYFSASDIVLAPYQRHLGSSNVLLLAAVHGRPALSQDYGLMGEYVRRHGLGLAVDTTRPSEIAAAIQRMLDRPGDFSPTSDTQALLRARHDERCFAPAMLRRLATVRAPKAEQTARG